EHRLEQNAGLKIEFDKLLGELRLGNDNEKVKKELKPLTMQMYQNGIISDKEFDQIISQLI
ncbi:TPA: hypothetical protein N0F65_003602, partial [Lagenidium giganteum]